MKSCNKHGTHSKTSLDFGFTLIELLVVISIIGLLSSVVLANLNTIRSKGRDTKRISDLHNIQLALELYYSKYGTYLVSGTGYSGNGNGWVNYEGEFYTKSVARGLQEEGLLSASIVEDPTQSPGYMLYLCETAQVYAISATKENPTAQDLSNIQKTCNGIGANGTYTWYGKNYAVTNKLY